MTEYSVVLQPGRSCQKVLLMAQMQRELVTLQELLDAIVLSRGPNLVSPHASMIKRLSTVICIFRTRAQIATCNNNIVTRYHHGRNQIKFSYMWSIIANFFTYHSCTCNKCIKIHKIWQVPLFNCCLEGPVMNPQRIGPL